MNRPSSVFGKVLYSDRTGTSHCTLILQLLSVSVGLVALGAQGAGALSAGFTANRGQVDEDVLYYTIGRGVTVFFTPDALVFDLREPMVRPDPDPGRGNALRRFRRAEAGSGSRLGCAIYARFRSAKQPSSIEGRVEAVTRYSYFLGNDADKWRTNVPSFEELVYHDLWPGVDLVFKSRDGELVYELVGADEHDLPSVVFEYDGAGIPVSRADARVWMETAVGRITELRSSSREGRFLLRRGGLTGHAASSQRDDPSLLLWSTYLGGSSGDQANESALDSMGNLVVTGATSSSDFPHSPGSYDVSHNGSSDIFVAKLSSTGSALLWSTFVGGESVDGGYALALDESGNPIFIGDTSSPDFPTTGGAYDPSPNGDYDVFVAKLSNSGSALLWSTVLGGGAEDYGNELALDPSGNPVCAGMTSSVNFPATPGAYDTSYNGSSDIYVAKLSSDGSALLWNTFLGGSADEVGGFGFALDPSANPVLTGETSSPEFPTTPGAFDTSYDAGDDVFVCKLSSSGSTLLWSTFLGGSSDEWGIGLALDSSANPVVTGTTFSLDFPTTPGAFDDSNTGAHDAFAAKISHTGSTLLWSTFLGGHSNESAQSLTIDHSDNPILTGYTGSSDFPITPGAYDSSHNGAHDMFVTWLSSTGSTLLWSTFVGGSDYEYPVAVDLDASMNLILLGSTWSSDFPTTPDAYDDSWNGGTDDGFILTLHVPGLEPTECWPYALSYADFEGIDRTAYSDAAGFSLGIHAEEAGGNVLTGYESTCWSLPEQSLQWSGEGCEEFPLSLVSFSQAGTCPSFHDLRLQLEIDGNEVEAIHKVVSDFPLLAEEDLGTADWGHYGDLEGVLEAFAPVLRFHDGEKYYPVRVDVSLHNASLRTDGPDRPDPAPPEFPDRDLVPEDLAQYSWPFFTLDLPCDPSDPDCYETAYEVARDAVPDPYVVYATAVRDFGEDWQSDADDLIILQYWMNYYFNDNETETCTDSWQCFNGIPGIPVRQVHEGDWEHVSVALDRSLNVLGAYFGGHGDQALAWEDVETQAGHPVVYVSRGGHANYPHPDVDCMYVLPVLGCVKEYHLGDGLSFVPPELGGGDETYSIEVLPRWAELPDVGMANRWIEFSGYWGTGQFHEDSERINLSTDVWRGPAFRKGWPNPYAEEFASMEFLAASPVDLLVRDPLNREVGPEVSDIPRARYEVFLSDSLLGEVHRSVRVTIPFPMAGEYHVDVVPIEGALPSDTYSLWEERQWIGAEPETTVLAVDVPIDEIPPEGYAMIPDVPHVGRSELVPAYWNLDWEPDDTEPIEWHLTPPNGAFDVGDLIPESLRLNGTIEPILPVTIQDSTLIVRFPRGLAVVSIGESESISLRRVLLTGMFADSLLRLESPGEVWLLATMESDETAKRQMGLSIECSGGNVVHGPVDLHLNLPLKGDLRVGIYDVAGRLVSRLADGPHEQGSHPLRWDTRSETGTLVPAGMYFVRAEIEGDASVKRLILVR